MSIVHNYIVLKALPSTDYSNYSVPSSQSLRRLGCSPSVLRRPHHLSMRSSDAKSTFQHQAFKVGLSSDTRSYFFMTNRFMFILKGNLKILFGEFETHHKG